MSGSKRARPPGYAEGAGSREPAAKVLKEDTAAIYEATLNKLKLGARAATGVGPRLNAPSPCSREGSGGKNDGVQGLVTGVRSDSPVAMAGLTIPSPGRCATPPHQSRGGPRPCYVCVARASKNVCFHCSRGCCEQCSRRCDGCQELFCSTCSTANYNERYDRSFCFDCNTKASVNHYNLPFRSSAFNDEARDMEFL